ncbi:Solute carrier family 13 member 1 [Tupaia chinensis]|uniref:Solute carrier family 13 member 1 n=1 Tax=Tupaia chinensis TaxID=246437 RepID=L9KST9_TUPCH|nr:Solute carrier family 13 member 1 [Tupaia chinensis]
MISQPCYFTFLSHLPSFQEAECAYTLFVVAVFWLTEALPLSVTALLPALMLPMFGVMPSKTVASAYFKDFHLLLIGVICLATSIEKWNLHKRIALRMVMMVGMNPAWLTLGFMSSTAFLSMWLSNTSTAAMVMPIVEAVAQQIISAEAEVEATQMTYFSGSTNHGLEIDGISVDRATVGASHLGNKHKLKNEGYSTDAGKFSNKMDLEKNSSTGTKYRTKKDHMLCKLMCLCIAYSSTIGGLTTITGTSTNLIFTEHFNTRYPDCRCLNFGSWFMFSFPVAILILFLSWIWLQWLFLGFKYPGFATDSTVALLVGLLFFVIPAKKLTKTTPTGEMVAFDYSPLITWKEFQSFMPWDIAILVGGGFALADGCEESGLSKWIGNKLSPLGSLPVWLIILIASLMVTSLTEVASNPATITLLLPILSPLAEAIHMNPLYILIPTTLCTSFSFLLPVANPPNAIVFSYGHLKVIDMVKAGLGVNIVGVAVVMLGMFTWIPPMFDLYTYPSWAPTISNETMP